MMLFRRVLVHVREQNWVAVCIDFVIVVLGVFVGLQVQAWSDQRALVAMEEKYLQQLHTEIALNSTLTRRNVDNMEQLVASGKAAVNFLEADTPCTTDCWRLLVDFFTASQVFRPAFPRATYDEMQRLGLPRSPTLRSKVEAYYIANEVFYLGIDQDPKIRKTFREVISVSAHEQLWANCHRLKDSMEYLLTDCSPALPEADVVRMLEALRAMPEVLQQMQYWIGMHALWIPSVSDVLSKGDDALSGIESVVSIH